MDERTTGLILRTRPLTETSLIVQWLTRDLGRLATVAKGARRSKSPFLGKLDIFYLADLSFARSRRSELHTLREISLRETHNALREELGYLQQAAYCAVLIEQTTETETPLPVIFRLMIDLLTCLPSETPQPRTIFAFEMKLLNELGMKPNLKEGKLSTGAKQILHKLSEMEWSSLCRLKLSVAQATEIDQFLNSFLIYHLGKIPKGRTAALASE